MDDKIIRYNAAIFPSVMEFNNTVNTYLYITDDVGVIVNSQGDVITVYPK